MSFLTEYFDEYRQHPIRKTITCRPENRFAKLEGKWLDPKLGSGDADKPMSHEEIEAFIKATMRVLRGRSTYYNDYCAHLLPELKTRPFVPRPKKKRPCKETEHTAEVSSEPPPPPLALKDTEVMRGAQALYERDMDRPTLEPLPTHFRILGYARPRLFKTGTSEYAESVARVAYETVVRGSAPRFVASNGARPRFGYSPGDRQPPVDAAPFDGERLY